MPNQKKLFSIIFLTSLLISTDVLAADEKQNSASSTVITFSDPSKPKAKIPLRKEAHPVLIKVSGKQSWHVSCGYENDAIEDGGLSNWETLNSGQQLTVSSQNGKSSHPLALRYLLLDTITTPRRAFSRHFSEKDLEKIHNQKARVEVSEDAKDEPVINVFVIDPTSTSAGTTALD